MTEHQQGTMSYCRSVSAAFSIIICTWTERLLLMSEEGMKSVITLKYSGSFQLWCLQGMRSQ